MAGKYRKMKKALFCPNASRIGRSRYEVKAGDLILFKQEYQDGSTGQVLARVLGLATHAGNGEKYPKPRLAVLAAGDALNHGFERHVPVEDVAQVFDPGDFTRWFLFGNMPETELAYSLVEYGGMSNNYLAKFLTSPEGDLRKDWRDVAFKRTS